MILPQIHSGVSGEGWWTCNPKSAKTKTPLVRQAKRLIWKLKQMKNDTRRWIQPMTTFSDCWFIACGFVASREPSQRISEVEMFKHLPSISDAQYFLSHETVKLQMYPPRLPATACYWTSWIFTASLSVKDPRHTASHIVGCFQSLLPGANGKTSVETEFFSMNKILSSQFSWSKNPWVEHGGTGVPTECEGLIMSHPTTLATLCCQRIHDLRAMHDLFSHCLSPFIAKLNDFP